MVSSLKTRLVALELLRSILTHTNNKDLTVQCNEV